MIQDRQTDMGAYAAGEGEAGGLELLHRKIDALARRQDLGQLHKALVQKFAEGGGEAGRLETRLAALEARAEETARLAAEMKASLAHLEGFLLVNLQERLHDFTERTLRLAAPERFRRLVFAVLASSGATLALAVILILLAL